MTKNYTLKKMKLVLFWILLLVSPIIQAQITISSDNAGNYAAWTNGSNAGTGFTTWDYWTQNTDASHFAGHFLGSSVAQGFGDINTSNQSFAMYGNPYYAAFPPQANAQRFLNNTGSTQVAGRSFLLPGQSFKIDLAIAFRDGYKGIDLLDQNFTPLFNFNVTNNLYTTSTSADLGWTYNQASVFQLEVQQTDTNTYIVIITRGSDVYNSGNRTGQFSGVKLYVGNTSGGNNLNNLFFNNMLLQRCAVTTTWNGSAWNNGLPNGDKAVAFTGNYTSTGNISACSVSVSGGAQVTIADSHTFTIENNITVAGGSALVFENNASLLQTNSSAVNTGNITYKRNSTPMRFFEYTYWSSPVAGQTLVNFSPLTSPSRYFSFDAGVANNWVLETPTNAMQAGKGYAIRSPDDYTTTPQIFNGTFTGTPNNGDISTSVVAFNPGLLNYNLLGNPYPSAISVISLLDNSNLGTLYFWTHNTAIAGNNFTTSDYAIRTRTTGTAAISGGTVPGLYIAAGQGFFASSATTGTLTFKNSMRTISNNNQFYRQAQNALTEPLNYYIHLNLTNALGAFKQIAIGYQELATIGYDFGTDAPASTEGAITFYSIIPPYTIGFGIQGRSYPWDINDVIDLGFNATIAGDYTIAIDHVNPFFDTQAIFIEDALLGTYHDLKTGPYNFNTAVGVYNSRFKIHYQNLLATTNFAVNASSVLITTFNTEIEIASTSEKIKSIQVYDVLGRMLLDRKNVNENKCIIPTLKKENQALIIKVELENNQVITKKLIF